MDCPFDEIDRESIVDWLAFAFYSKSMHELNPNEYEEIKNFIEKIETIIDIFKWIDGNRDSLKTCDRIPINYIRFIKIWIKPNDDKFSLKILKRF